MTPRVVRDQREASLVTEEFRQKLKNASAIVENEATAEDEVDVSQKNAPGK
jgi:general secretion pathway protein D